MRRTIREREREGVIDVAISAGWGREKPRPVAAWHAIRAYFRLPRGDSWPEVAEGKKLDLIKSILIAAPPLAR